MEGSDLWGAGGSPGPEPTADAKARGSAVLVLGGTAEANDLVRVLRERFPGRRVILSLAGRTRQPALPFGVETRSGGFGGAAGLAAFIAAESVSLLIDATHPFAAGIARNAAKAAGTAGVRRIKLVRPEWRPVDGDRWTKVACLGAARDALPKGARPFLALGRQHLAPFLKREDLRPLARMIEPPDPPLPESWTLILARAVSDVEAEARLMRDHAVTHLVARNSGGAASYAKVAAARALFLPVIMIARPPAPGGEAVATVKELLAALEGGRAA
ncbi:cobalt-precorrin-6A reductase [Jiella sonneratiae]|uniref:Cobalt-precorrin-6A reductase n=1 Tax=Jiella sonneratiae TaxID=2816856 RepID=A0ABS3J5Y6_9HYPH|nr:cobalt-precorrin-6A reductase [Jiella sonneratiae]MBO0905070.1 cobalt-precorrin-6A reductase [Jiella sonneratiae]